MIRDDATQAQITAANPQASTWLSANAGSGKTRVLTDRVARLLLEKVDPQNILCLTYTKAAAAEMQNRLFERLGKWAMMEDDKLRADLSELGFEGSISNDDLRNARRLFAGAIETPGGLKIQTIHSFCSSVLRRFPLEAQVSPQFREMEDRTADLLRAEVMDALVAGPDKQAVTGILAHFTGSELDKLTKEIVSHRDAFGSVPTEAELRGILGLTPHLELRDIQNAVFGNGGLEVIRSVQKICQSSSTMDRKAAAKLLNVSGSIADLAVLESVLLFGKGAKSPYGAKIGSFPTKDIQTAHPELIDDLNVIMETVAASRMDRLGLLLLDRTTALYRFATKFVPAFEARKQALGLLDFDDLIRKTRNLLTDRNVAQWVLFRLDGGIDHVLVDEAQDTSPDQWAVIERLTQDFSSGAGSDPQRQRTIFVVGDQKQSIYSFQGADPAIFDAMQAHFKSGLAQTNTPLQQNELIYSFRSAQAVLRVVDETFDTSRNMAGGLGDHIRHMAFEHAMPGRVDLWPAIEPSKDEKSETWWDPVDMRSDAHHTTQMANRVAKQIRWIIENERLPKKIGDSYFSAPITEGDFLILVQRRSELFSEIIRACKAHDLNVAGADRLRIGGELAVKDIVALLQFLALPEDDYALACALKSPLFAWSEQELYSLAQPRPEGQFLWSAMRENKGHIATKLVLRDLRKQADFMRPYDLIERILTRHDGRRKLLARLGAEAEDGVDELLSQALAYESNSTPSLTGFLTWLETDDVQVKRQMDNQGDRIRVMTVHGAKGLEAPIVILPETQERRPSVNQEILPNGNTVIWRPVEEEQPDLVKSLIADRKAKDMQERMRLLYVAMTRAEKWLIVGAAGELGKNKESWYDIVADGMDHAGAAIAQSGDLAIRRVSQGDWELPSAPADQPPVAVPFQPMSVGPATLPKVVKTLAPSDLDGAKVLAGEVSVWSEDDAKARGRLIHLLLEHLPMLPQDERAAFGRRLVAANEDVIGSDDLVGQVIGLLDNPDLAPIFTDTALVEADITANIAELGGRRIHGAIDRLVVTDDRVLAIDYKSNRLVPQSADETPEGLLRQMGAYHAALCQIYPDKVVEVAILWTETARLMPLSANLVSSALKRVTAS